MQQVLETQRQIEQTAQELVDSMKKTAEQMQANELFELETVQEISGVAGVDGRSSF